MSFDGLAADMEDPALHMDNLDIALFIGRLFRYNGGVTGI